MKFIHISDVHLGAKPDAGKPWSETRGQEIEETFDRILDIANERSVDMLLIVGDLFHVAPSVTELAKLDGRLGRLKKTRTVIAAGSSDFIEEGGSVESFRFNSNTVLLPADRFTSVRFDDINTCVTGFSYGQAEYSVNFADGVKPEAEGATNILLMYGGDTRHGAFDFRRLAGAGFDYVALGSLRKPKHMVKNRMAYPGSPEPVSHTDTGKHGFIYGQCIGGETRIKWEPIACRSYVNLGFEVKPQYTERQIEDVIRRQIDKLGDNNIYKVILKGQKGRGVKPDFGRLPANYMICDVVDNTMFDYNAEGLMRDNENNLLGRFISELSGRDDEVGRKALQYGLEAVIATGEK